MNNDRRIIWGVIAILSILLLAGIYFFNPEQYSLTSCFFKDKTGTDCPGCGITHSIHSFFHLRITESFKHHLLGPIFSFGLLFLILVSGYQSFTGKQIFVYEKWGKSRYLLLVFLVIWLVYWLYKII
ncbi:MAG: DUF2752 domain-containing protein [Bacteroidales bacterium]|nr:DUF2752 domain-containing protein [Bacteroidales bacterium]